VTECIHELQQDLCGTCGVNARRVGDSSRLLAGKSFALIVAPGILEGTFLHLNREGERWKIRWYSSPNRPAVEMEGSGFASKHRVEALDDINILQEIAYPHSTSPSGVPVDNFRFWFDEINRMNAKYDISK
jgi:hypothetical protein